MLDALWSVPIQGQVAERLARPQLGRWLAQVQQVRRCSHPVRLAGTSQTVDIDDRRGPQQLRHRSGAGWGRLRPLRQPTGLGVSVVLA